VEYVLVNKQDEIVFSANLASDVGIGGATTYFQGVKQMPDREVFSNLWKVMTRTEYDRIYEATTRKPSSQSQGYDWWKEEKAIVDDEMSLFERKRRVGPPK
jgi:hypothetical protein|tara:strand:+ start:2161 stop:2463 length:303 start_codon:yes stop_codon:yes gene_type:complete